jgi:hypothetical protein
MASKTKIIPTFPFRFLHLKISLETFRIKFHFYKSQRLFKYKWTRDDYTYTVQYTPTFSMFFKELNLPSSFVPDPDPTPQKTGPSEHIIMINIIVVQWST